MRPLEVRSFFEKYIFMSIKMKFKVVHDDNNIYLVEDLTKGQTSSSSCGKWILRRIKKVIIIILLAASSFAAPKMVDRIPAFRNENLESTGTMPLLQIENSNTGISENTSESVVKINILETRLSNGKGKNLVYQVLFWMYLLFPFVAIVGLTILLIKDDSGIRYEKLDMLNKIRDRICAENFVESDYESSRQIKAVKSSIKARLLEHYMDCITEI